MPSGGYESLPFLCSGVPEHSRVLLWRILDILSLDYQDDIGIMVYETKGVKDGDLYYLYDKNGQRNRCC